MRCLAATVAAFSLLLIVPAAASASECPAGEVEANGTAASDWPAGGPSGRCVPFAEWESERSAAREAREAEETSEAEVRRQQEAAEAHARQLTEKKETGGPASTLHVTVTSVHGTSYRNPGHTSLYVNTNQFAEVFFKVTYPQHPRWEADYFHFKERLGVKEASWEPGEGNTANDPWSCRAPMLVEDWEVRVEGENGGVVEAGPGLVATGQIVDDVSPKWCATAKRREAAVQAKRRHSSNTRARRRS